MAGQGSTSFHSLVSALRPEDLCFGDPLCLLLLRISRGHLWKIAIISLAIFGLGLFGALAGPPIWLNGPQCSESPYCYGEPVSWLRLNLVYFCIWLFFAAINLYILTWIIQRELIAIKMLNRMFSTYTVELNIYHED